MNTTLAAHLDRKRLQEEGLARIRVDFEVEAERARLEGVSVLPGQAGVAYHYTVMRRDGMYYDAYDLQDAQVMADNLAVHFVGTAKVIETMTGKVVSYHSYFDAKQRKAA